MQGAIEEYNSLLANGELLNLFPEMMGDWKKDKKAFTIIYENNQKLLNQDYLDLDDEEDELDDNNYW